MCKMIFGTLVLFVSLGRVASADDQADARAILDAGIKAQGGEALLSKFTAVHSKTKGIWHDGDKKTPVSYGSFFDGGDKSRILSFDEDNKLTSIEVINGKEGWEKDGDQETEKLSGEKLDSRRENVYVNWVSMLFPLQAKEFRLSVLDETDVKGRSAVGILVKHEKHQPVKLYFDKESHLFVKLQHKYKNVDNGKEYDEECVASDYRSVQETKQPFKIEVLWDKETVLDVVVTEMKLYDKPLDEKLFLKP
jgi:hypothetical protein